MSSASTTDTNTIGLEVFDAASGEEYDSIFIHNAWELKDYLGVNWREVAAKIIIKKLYCIYKSDQLMLLAQKMTK